MYCCPICYRVVTDSEIQEMLRHEMMRNSKDLTDDPKDFPDDPTLLEGSSTGLLMSREERDNLNGSKMTKTQGGEIRF